MQKKQKHTLLPLRELSHPDFMLNTQRDMFRNAFYQVYKNSAVDIASQELQTLEERFYDACYIDPQAPLRSLLNQLKTLLKPSVTLEVFLSNYFYIILNYYTKSLYTHDLGWKRISMLVRAIDELIDWSKSIGSLTSDSQLQPEAEEQALVIFETLRQKRAKVTLLNTYHGVPIQYKAIVIHTNEQGVYLKAHPLQEAAARSQQSVYVLSEDIFANDLLSRVKAVRYKGNVLLELTKLIPLHERLYPRRSIRVQPQKMLQIHIEDSHLRYRGMLFDISLGGLALTGSQTITLDKHTPVIITLPEIMFSKKLEIHANLVHRSRFQNNSKLHFKLLPTPAQETLLGKYIAKREQEIVQSLRQWY